MIYYQKIINNESKAFNSFFLWLALCWELKNTMMGDKLATQVFDWKTPFNVPSGKARNGLVLGLTQNTLIYI